jgi:hypothetical protein
MPCIHGEQGFFCLGCGKVWSAFIWRLFVRQGICQAPHNKKNVKIFENCVKKPNLPELALGINMI